MIDIDDLRNQQIMMADLTGADNVYTFYHDETNNVKKLRINDRGFNVELKTFILGGFVHDGAPRVIDIAPLRRAMRIQNSAPELKLAHVARGSFLEVLKSEKLATFLQWVLENGLTVHYHALDPLYWSIVDIVDSILARSRNHYWILHHALLKSDLSLALRADLHAIAALFHRYDYPSLAPAHRAPFLNELIAVVERNEALMPAANAAVLKQVLRSGRELGELSFIEDNKPHELIDDFSTFYLSRLSLFKYSTHILDMEDSIRDYFLTTPLVSNGRPVTHYRFADSRSEVGIQISDIMVGVLGKMHSYLSETSAPDVVAARAQLTGVSLTNANLLRDLIDASHERNIAFLHHVASQHDIAKMEWLLRLSGD